MDSAANQTKSALIIGVDSTIGRWLKNTLSSQGWKVFGTSRKKSVTQDVFYLDLADLSQLQINYTFDVIYMCASITQISQCQSNPDYARLINVDAQLQLVQYFLNQNTHFVYLSSNAVFSGQQPWYKTTDPPSPITHYGECKALVEKALLHMTKKITIVRLTKVLTPDYPLFSQWVTDLKNKIIITPFHNLNLCPISINTVCECLKEIADKKRYGIIHLSGQIDVSYQKVAEYLAQLVNAKKSLIKEIPMLDSMGHEKTPFYTSLDMTESKALFVKMDTSFLGTMNNLYGCFSG